MSTSLLSQNDQKAPFILFDQVIGKTNSGIFNGIEYFEKYKVKNDKHQFFQHIFFIWGSVVYKNQPYYKIALKYNVHTDELLIKNSEILDAPITQLDKNQVRQFELNDHVFKHLSFRLKKDQSISGFFEVLSESEDVSIFKKHRKKLIRTVDEKVLFTFKDQFQYYIRYRNTHYLLKKFSSLTSIFPEQKALLKNSLAKYEKLKKSDPDKYIVSIISDLNSFILNKT